MLRVKQSQRSPQHDAVLGTVKAWPAEPGASDTPGATTSPRLRGDRLLTAPARGVIAPAQVGTKKRSSGRTKKLTGSKIETAAPS